MKTSNLISIVGLFCLLCTPTKMQAQMDENPWGGLQSTWENSINNDDPPLFAGNVLIGGGDIQMLMMAQNENPDYYDVPDSFTGFFGFNNEYDNHGFMYHNFVSYMNISFDWENRAQKMIGGEQINITQTTYGLDTNTIPEITDESYKKDTSIQYTDIDGNWYTLAEISNGYIWIRFNGKMAMEGLLEGLIDLAIETQADEITKKFIGLLKEKKLHYIINNGGDSELAYGINELVYIWKNIQEDNDYNSNLENIGEEELNKIKEKLEESLDALLHDLYDEIQGFPIFIHWAFLYTPETVRKMYPNAKEDTCDCFGVPDNCTFFTRTSGPEKGKQLFFDPNGRLLAINDKKDGMALYLYDRDFTVTLPEKYYTMADILSGKVIIQRN